MSQNNQAQVSTEVQVEPQVPANPVSTETKVDHVAKAKEFVSSVDLFAASNVFFLFMFWVFFLAETGSERNYAAVGFAGGVCIVFLIDLMFRLLSYRIPQFDPAYWNHLWLCLFPIVFFLLAAGFEFDSAIHDDDPLAVWNAIFFWCYMAGVTTYTTIYVLKNLF